MKTYMLLLCLIISFATIAQEQAKEIFMTINGKEVTRDEFERIYTKNNQNPVYDSASIHEYLELFINFKLKVAEAEALKYDTLTKFTREMEIYRGQLEKPYFSDPKVDEELMKEAFERMHWDLNASHILVMCSDDALPKDTLIAYNKAQEIVKKLKKSDFNDVAFEMSEDPSAKQNKGQLGYFTAFQMVYPFESAAYNTPVGEISKVIRTRFGYHIIKVHDKRPNIGNVQVAHIMFTTKEANSNSLVDRKKELAFAVLDSIKSGASFEEMAEKYSDDKGSARFGGKLRAFGRGRMVPEFEDAAFGLQNPGDISEPVRTKYGWHIIKLIEKQPLKGFNEMKDEIKNNMSKDIRAEKAKQVTLERLKNEYKVKIYKKAFASLLPVLDSTIYTGDWESTKAEGLNETIFTMNDSMVFTQQDFSNFISLDKMNRFRKPIEITLNDEITRWIDDVVVNFEKSRLEAKYPDFKNLVQEYHDGILLFNLTDDMVWSKAVKDTAGLEKFYQENKNNYMWNERREATIYTFNNKNHASAIAKIATKAGKKKLNPELDVNKLLSKVHKKDSSFSVSYNTKKYSKGDSELIDGISLISGLSQLIENKTDFQYVYIHGNVAPEPKLLNEAKGLITADYQNYLEKKWISELRAKYNVVINQETLAKIIK